MLTIHLYGGPYHDVVLPLPLPEGATPPDGFFITTQGDPECLALGPFCYTRLSEEAQGLTRDDGRIGYEFIAHPPTEPGTYWTNDPTN